MNRIWKKVIKERILVEFSLNFLNKFLFRTQMLIRGLIHSFTWMPFNWIWQRLCLVHTIYVNDNDG